MIVCLECKKEFEKATSDDECPHCYGNTHLIKEEYDNVISYKHKIVLFKGNKSHKPAYAFFRGFNKFGWAMFDIVNTNTSVFGNQNSFLELNDKYLNEFEKLKLEYAIEELTNNLNGQKNKLLELEQKGLNNEDCFTL